MPRDNDTSVMRRSDHRRVLAATQAWCHHSRKNAYRLGFRSGVVTALFVAVLALPFVAVGAFELGLQLGNCK